MEFLFDYLDEQNNYSAVSFNLSMQTNAKLVFHQPSNRIITFKNAVDILNVFGLAVIICMGCFGNIFSLIVFCTANFKWKSSTIYLAFMNCVDTIFLFCLIITWLGFLDVHLIHNVGMCQMTIYLSYVSGFLSVYAVVSFTLERCVVVYFPLKRSVWCTRKRATMVVSSLTLVSLVIYTYAIWGYGLIELGDTGIGLCMMIPRFYAYVTIMTLVDSVITLILPSFFIIVLNVCLTFKLWHFIHHRRMHNGTIRMSRKPATECSNPHGENQLGVTSIRDDQLNTSILCSHSTGNQGDKQRIRSKGLRQRMQLRTTKSLIVVSTLFVVLNVPSHAFRIFAIISEFNNPMFIYSSEALLWQHICQLVYYCNFASNFFLYCACLKQFRVASLRLIQTVWNNIKLCVRKLC